MQVFLKNYWKNLYRKTFPRGHGYSGKHKAWEILTSSIMKSKAAQPKHLWQEMSKFSLVVAGKLLRVMSVYRSTRGFLSFAPGVNGTIIRYHGAARFPNPVLICDLSKTPWKFSPTRL